MIEGKEPWCPIARMDCRKPCVFWENGAGVCLVAALVLDLLAQGPLDDEPENEGEDKVLKTDQGEVEF